MKKCLCILLTLCLTFGLTAIAEQGTPPEPPDGQMGTPPDGMGAPPDGRGTPPDGMGTPPDGKMGTPPGGMGGHSSFSGEYDAVMTLSEDAELSEDLPIGRRLGYVTEEKDAALTWQGSSVSLRELLGIYQGTLEGVYPTDVPGAKDEPVPAFSCRVDSWPAPAVRTAKPRVLIPAFPGTNCEYDSARAAEDAGAAAEIFVIRNRSAEEIARSAEEFAKKARESQIIFIPGGFSGGDEPDGSAKFITAFFRNPGVKDAVTELLERRDGLMCGICNGFQALIKLGLVPYGRILETDENCPTLTFNTIGRHQSRIVRTRVASNRSPWLALAEQGGIYSMPISHGEGRFLAGEDLIRTLSENGQIATQYVDLAGNPSMDLRFNPNGSLYAIEGITSPDGRVFGKMGHSERVGKDLYQNVPGNYDIRMFESAVKYFK